MLSIEKKTKIVSAGKKVYLGYLLLDIINDEKNNYFTLDGEKNKSLNEHITDLVRGNKDKSINQNIKIGKRDCVIHLKKNSDNTYNVKITNAVRDGSNLGDGSIKDQTVDFKPKNEYKENDFLYLCSTHELTLSCNESGKYAFSTKVYDHLIGGPDKIDLYPVHISNLYQIIKHVENGKNVNTLIAMATGSGKSFTQALLAFVLHIADYRGVFAVHQNSLADQLKGDFSRLLPESVTDTIKLCEQDTIGNIEPNSHIITTHDILFKEKKDKFNELFKSNSHWVSIDEAHNATKVELYKKGIEELKMPITFLTATPTESITKNVGCVINLSPEEKEKQGICKRDIKEKRIAKSRIEKMKNKSKFKIGERIALWFAGIIEKERLSTAHELIDGIEESVFYRKSTDPFYVKDVGNESKEVRKSLRWNVHLPIGEKSLLLVGRGSHDPVVNFHIKFHGDSTESAYKNGNRISRKNVYDFFGLNSLSDSRERLDEDYLRGYEEIKKETRKASLYDYLIDHHKIQPEKANEYIEKYVDYSNDAAKYQEFNVLHNIIENTLSHLTGYDSITLDKKRRHDLSSLIEEVRGKLSKIEMKEYETQVLVSLVSEGIPNGIAENIEEQESVWSQSVMV